MEQRWDFFKQGETTWGEFYPTHYILAGYESDADAQAAEEAFRASGVAAEDVRAATGQFVAGYLETRGDRNALDKLGSKLADVVGTENEFVAQDKLFARRGGAFLFVYAPREQDAENAKAVFASHPPTFARRYLHVAIEELVLHKDKVHTIRGTDTPRGQQP